MTKMIDYDPGDPFPAAWTDAIAEFISTQITPNFIVEKQSSTVLRVPASTGNDQVGAGIEGKWRYITSTINFTHPGGAAATFDVWITAADNDTPLEDTDFTFDLEILASGTPSADLSRKVATCVWNGTAITDVAMLVGPGMVVKTHGSTHALSGTDPLPADSVGSSQISADAVGSAEIAAGAVGSTEIATDAVGSDEIVASAVGTAEIQDDAVTNAKLAANAVTNAEILDGTIGVSELASDIPMPVGAVFDYAGSSTPTGTLLCDGSAVSRITYANLYAVIGTIYGSGDGSTTFNLPNCVGRATYGKGTGGLGSHVDVNTLGATDSVLIASRRPAIPLTIAQLPSHTHALVGAGNVITSSGGSHYGYPSASPLGELANTNIANTGSDDSHNHGYIIFNKCIKF